MKEGLLIGLLAASYTACASASGDAAVVYMFAGQVVCFLLSVYWLLRARQPWRTKLLPLACVLGAGIVLAVLAELPDYTSRHVWIDTASLLTCAAMLLFVRRSLKNFQSL